jgi:DNA helicase-2/ATP-dependent DNA helicase PcrA
VQFATPGGIVKGHMEKKRQYLIKNGKIESMFDTSVTIGDELLQEVLGKHGDAEMKNIVATIQKEQNRIIRDEQSHLLVVLGAAGSGKTSAALQRIAYLLYRYRDTLNAQQIVLFSPNPMFNTYISAVLPSLGEENMQQTTFQEFLESQIGKTFSLEDAYEQIESLLTNHDPDQRKIRRISIDFKGSLAFMHLIDRYVQHLSKQDLRFHPIRFRDEILLSAEELQEQFYSQGHEQTLPQRIHALAKWILDKLRERERLEREQRWVELEIESLDPEQYRRANEILQKKQGEFDYYDEMRKLLAKHVVRKAFKPLYNRVKRLKFVDLPATYAQLFQHPEPVSKWIPNGQLPAEWEEICALTMNALSQKQLLYEDATPFLYLKSLIVGFQPKTWIKHVFIDEAQDYTPFQLAFLTKLFPRSKFTVLGDLNQAIWAHQTDQSIFRTLASSDPDRPSKIYLLSKSYRSTRPIIEFTREIIGQKEGIEPFHRPGKKPVITHAANEETLIQEIADKIEQIEKSGAQTIAVICKTAKESREVYSALRNHRKVRLIEKDTVKFEAGAMVIPSYLSKGFEFDAVIVYNANRDHYRDESERKLFYTICTRAMHELYLYYTDQLTPFLDGVSPDLYIHEKK